MRERQREKCRKRKRSLKTICKECSGEQREGRGEEKGGRGKRRRTKEAERRGRKTREKRGNTVCACGRVAQTYG